MARNLSVSRQYAPLRVCADICLYFYVISLFSYNQQYVFSDVGELASYTVNNLISPWSRLILAFVAACFAVGLFVVRLDSTALRFLLSLLPGLCFLMSPLHPLLLFHIAAWIYFIIFMAVGNFEVYLDSYRQRVRLMLIFALMMTLFLIILHFGTEDLYFKRLFGGEIYGLLFFVFSVISLRGMRLSFGSPKTLKVLDIAYVVALPALLVAAVFLLRGVVPAFTFIFSAVSRFIIRIVHLLFPNKEDQYLPPDEEYIDKKFGTKQDDSTIIIASSDGNSPDAGMAEGRNIQFHFSPKIMFYVMIALLVVALIIIAVMLIRRKKKLDNNPTLVSEIVEKASFKGLFSRMRSDASLPYGVRQTRKVYRAYLEYINSRFAKISSSDTSQDVLDISSGYLNVPENETLRELYIAARYGDPKSVTSEQVGEAKRCLSVIETVKDQATKSNLP